MAFNFRLSKTNSNNQSLKNTLGLYIFESLRQELKINSKNVNWTFKVSLGTYFAVAKWIMIYESKKIDRYIFKYILPENLF